jgi:drug/metabolite transporter (DMT)-like permease
MYKRAPALSSAPTNAPRTLGVIAMLFVVATYAFNFVAVRYSVRHGLQPLDLAGLRYSVAGLVLLPYFLRLLFTDRAQGPNSSRKTPGIGWPKALALACCAGSPYMLLFFFGLRFAPASHGAVLNPGIVPSVVFVGMVLLRRLRFSVARALSLALIVLGLVLVTRSSFSLSGEVLFGDLLLLLSGILWGMYTLLARLWNVKPLQAAAIVSVLSMVYVPGYVLFGYDGFPATSIAHVIVQAVLQGVINSVVALYLVTYAVQKLGAQLAALFSPLIPVITTLLAIPLLGEIPGALQWIGIVIVVLGMVSAAILDARTATH